MEYCWAIVTLAGGAGLVVGFMAGMGLKRCEPTINFPPARGHIPPRPLPRRARPLPEPGSQGDVSRPFSVSDCQPAPAKPPNVSPIEEQGFHEGMNYRHTFPNAGLIYKDGDGKRWRVEFKNKDEYDAYVRRRGELRKTARKPAPKSKRKKSA